MSSPRYLLGSGFCHKSKVAVVMHPLDFAEIWFKNTARHANPWPTKTVIITGAGDGPRQLIQTGSNRVDVIECQGDLGHLKDKTEGHKNHGLTGWATSMLACAMIAYNAELDFVFKEQDCLFFGHVIEQMYEDMGDGEAAIGLGLHGIHEALPSSQSLFLVRHRYIWRFVRDYLNEGEDNNGYGQGEKKFHRMRQKNPDKIRSLSFGVDRDRPLPFSSPVWYAQQFTVQELELLRSSQFI